MKPLHLILVALLAGAAGAAGGFLAARCSQCAPATASSEGLQADLKPSGVQPKPASREAELAAKVENLERALDAIHQDVAELRAGSSRTAAVVEPEKAPIDTDAISFAAAHKNAIKAVIEEDRLEQARKAEEERKQRAIDQAVQNADRVAQKLGLNAGQTKQLEAFSETSRQRLDELRANMQNGTGDPQALRQSFQDFRTQSETELTTLYGSELAGKIIDEGLGGGMGRGGPGGWAGGPGGGGQGGNATGGPGGGGRRARGGGAGGNNGQTTSGGGGQPGGG